MNELLTVYLIISTFLLGFAAGFWNSHGAVNIVIKASFIAAALAGAACNAKLLL